MNNCKRGLVAAGLLLGTIVAGDSQAQFDKDMVAPIPFGESILDDGQDLIFPSIIDASKYLQNPVARWYLFTSPHRGADIRLYVANELKGPWAFQKQVIDVRLARADHASSPHVIWNHEDKKFFLYFHAPNSQTVYCHSSDGIRFEYGGVCVTRQMLSGVVGFESRSASYARVYHHTIPEYGNTYTMTLTASGSAAIDGTKPNAIVLCTSNDGKTWTARCPLIDDGSGGTTYKSLDACWLQVSGINYLVYARRLRADEGKDTQSEPVQLHFSEGDDNWREWRYRGVFYAPQVAYPDHNCARGADFISVDGRLKMAYEAGPKNQARIAVTDVTRFIAGNMLRSKR